MAVWTGGSDDSGSRAGVRLEVWEASLDAANNRSWVSFNLDVYDNSSSLGGTGTGSWSANINGTGYSGSLSYDFSGNSGASYRVLSSSQWVNHASDGSAVIYVAGTFAGTSPVGYAIAEAYTALTDYAFPPAAPTTPTLTRGGTPVATTAASGTGSVATITTASAHGLVVGEQVTIAGITPTGYRGTFTVTAVPSSTQFSYASTATGSQTVAGTAMELNGANTYITSSAPTSVATITSYAYRYSTDNSNWSAAVNMGNSTAATMVMSNLNVSGIYIQTRASSSEGAGAWSPSAFAAGIPTAPVTIATTRTARDVLVSIGTSPTNGGATVTAYKVQSSSDGGTTWTTPQDITSLSYTYAGLAPALTYLFRAYAVNSAGISSYATSYGVFVPASGKRYDGTTWQSMTTAKRFDGTAWNDIATGARNDGTNWVYLS